MKKLLMKLCGLVRKLRSSQPLQPMKVKRVIFCEHTYQIDNYYNWMQYLHDEIKEYKDRTQPMYWVSFDNEIGYEEYTEVK